MNLTPAAKLTEGLTQASGTPEVGQASTYPPLWRASYALLLLVLAMWIARFDRVIFALNTQPIKLSLALSDTQLGSLSGLGWGMAYGLAAFPLGILIDRRDRTKLILLAILAWSTFAVLTGFCTTYWQMFACRVGAGAAEAALFPASFSLICDLFPPKQRHFANIAYLGGAFFGASIGFAVGGLAIGAIEHSAHALPAAVVGLPVWRVAFFATALPSAALALLFLSASEPARQVAKVEDAGLADAAASPSFASFLRTHWVTVVCLFFGLVAVGIGSDEIVNWMPALLARSYGWSSAHAGQSLSLVFAVGSLTGIGLAGVLTHLFTPRFGDLAPLQTLRLGACVAALTLVALLFVRTADQLLIVATLHIVFAFVGFSVGPGLAMSIAPNHLRGRLYGMKSIVGTGAHALATVLVGVFSDHLFHGSSGGLRLALCATLIPISLLTLLSLMVVGRAMQRTFRAVSPG